MAPLSQELEPPPNPVRFISREADQDWSEGRAPRPLYHFPDGGGRHPQNPVRGDSAPHFWAAASTFNAMTAADPVASRLLDRTGVCGARRDTLSQREKVTGRAFDRQIGSTKRGDRYANCRIRTGFAFDRHICHATGHRKWSSGESRVRWTTGQSRDNNQSRGLINHICPIWKFYSCLKRPKSLRTSLTA